MAKRIQQLADLISTSVSTLNQICQENGYALPDMDEPLATKRNDAEAFRANATAAMAAKVAASACLQLAATLMTPTDGTFRVCNGASLTSAFKVALESHVTEILNEGGNQGLHADAISAKCGIDSNKIARILRRLVTNYCYKEVKPNVFANNRISSMMDSGKTFDEITTNPGSKFDQPSYAALCSHYADIDQNLNFVTWETLTDHSFVNKTVFNKAFQTEESLFPWLQRPENAYRMKRFASGMQGYSAAYPSDMIFRAHTWDDISPRAVVVDVGGNIGASVLPLARKYEQMKFVIQDLPGVVLQGEAFWKREFSEALAAGRVALQAHNFLEPQPVEDGSVFLLKHVLHNWHVSDCEKILNHLRKVAQKDTRLLVIDNCAPFACPLDEKNIKKLGEILAGNMDIAPTPLLANYGAINDTAYFIDQEMMQLFNGRDFTIVEYRDLFEQCGWKMIKCFSIDPTGGALHAIHGVPV